MCGLFPGRKYRCTALLTRHLVIPTCYSVIPTHSFLGKHRNIRARKDLQDWLGRVGLPYHSPHKFRHRHAVYAMKHAKDVPALKAVSPNLMHKNLSVTDGVYGVLSDLDAREQIAALGKQVESKEEIFIDLLKKLVKRYENPQNKIWTGTKRA